MRQHEDKESNPHSKQTPGTEQRLLPCAPDVADQRGYDHGCYVVTACHHTNHITGIVNADISALKRQ